MDRPRYVQNGSSLLKVEGSCRLYKYPHSQGVGGDLGFSVYTSISFTSVFHGKPENSCTRGLGVSMSAKTTQQKRDVKGLRRRPPGKGAAAKSQNLAQPLETL